MTPTWYDVLDVEPTATAEEIRVAWQRLVSQLGPTDRRFRVVNEAAEVLLDPQRRTAYDAELATSAAPAETTPDPVVEPAEDEPPTSLEIQHLDVDGTRRSGVPGWLIIATAIVTAVTVGVTAWLWLTKPNDAAVEDATRTAQAAAERAVVPILSYDYRHLDRDQAAAQGYLTGDYRKDYDSLFEVIKDNAPETKTKLQAEVIASGIVRSGEDRVQVFLLVDQARTNKQRQTPDVFKNWVTVSMQKVDGDWLVDDMST